MEKPVGNNLVCQTCKIFCSSLSNLKEHYESKKHKKKEQTITKESPNISIDVNNSMKKTDASSDPSKYCAVCDKNFSGPENAVDHYNSKKHKNKANIAETGSAITLLSCEYCNKKFQTNESLQNHCDTPKHKKKASAAEEMKKILSNNKNANSEVQEMTSELEANCIAIPDDGNCSSLEEQVANVVKTTMKCSVCAKSFTGLDPVNDHLKSKKHKKNVNAASVKLSNVVDMFTPFTNEVESLPKQLEFHLDTNPTDSGEASSVKLQNPDPSELPAKTSAPEDVGDQTEIGFHQLLDSNYIPEAIVELERISTCSLNEKTNEEKSSVAVKCEVVENNNEGLKTGMKRRINVRNRVAKKRKL